MIKKGTSKNITVLFASPNKKGSTAILADSFKRGAEESGHTVGVIDVCRMNVHPCIGCVRCGYEGPCVQKDDNEMIRQTLLSTDMVVFATPLYYYGMSAGAFHPIVFAACAALFHYSIQSFQAFL